MLIELFILTVLCQLSTQTERYVLFCERMGDLITLKCRDTTTDADLPAGSGENVRFWVNYTRGIRFDEPDLQQRKDVQVTIVNNVGVRFLITGALEGYYSCGYSTIAIESNIKYLISLQRNRTSQPLTTSYYSHSGGEIQLLCPNQPGNLRDCYFGKWLKDSRTIVEVQRPLVTNSGLCTPQETVYTIESKYHLDRNSFSLTFQSIEQSDGGSYHCELSVLNPESINRDTWPFESTLLSLKVDEDPVVLKGPDSVVVGLLDDTTNQPTFTCMVGGTREPTLFWTYIPSLDDGRLHIFSGGNYGILSNRTREDNGRYVVTSTLTFLSVTNTDGGIVTCNTGSDPNIIHADALLTVLGTADDIDVIVSRDNDIIYELEFPTEIQHPVTLNITYTSEEGATDCRVPNIRYNNTRTISYKEIVSEVPFPVYFVSIALVGVNGSQRITGPSTASGEKIDTTMLDPVKHIATLLGSVLAVFITAMMITTVAVIVFCYKQNELKLKYTKAVFDDPDKYTQYLKTKEEKDAFMYKVLKRHAKRIGADGEDDGEEEDLTDVLIQLLFESAEEGLNSDKNKYKEKFVKAVKRQVKDLHTKDREHPKSKDEEFESPTDQISAEGTKDEEPSRYHAGRDVSRDQEIKMSPEMSHTPIRVNRTTKESAV